jgi:hypothetical protein
MAEQGVKAALIENGAFAAGLEPGPLALAGEDPTRFAGNRELVDAGTIARRLLSAQALAAAECWEEGVTDPVRADLASLLGWGYPKYTGGVMSYIDTLGLTGFIAQCDALRKERGAPLEPSEWLRGQARENDRIYPSMA